MIVYTTGILPPPGCPAGSSVHARAGRQVTAHSSTFWKPAVIHYTCVAWMPATTASLFRHHQPLNSHTLKIKFLGQGLQPPPHPAASILPPGPLGFHSTPGDPLLHPPMRPQLLSARFPNPHTVQPGHRGTALLLGSQITHLLPHLPSPGRPSKPTSKQFPHLNTF